MQFSVTHAYDHPTEAVFAALTDVDMVAAKYEAVGQRDITLVRRDEGDDGSLTLATSRVVPLEVPGFAKKVRTGCKQPKGRRLIRCTGWSTT